MSPARLLTFAVALALMLTTSCTGRRKRPANSTRFGGDAGAAPTESEEWRRQACRDAYDRIVTMLSNDPDTAIAADEYRRQGELRQAECRTRMTEDIFDCVMSARSFERVLECDPTGRR